MKIIIKLFFELERFKKATKVYTDFKYIHLNFPDLKVLIDLKEDEQIVKSFYNTIKEKLYELLIYNNLDNGVFNYDTNTSSYQLKRCYFK